MCCISNVSHISDVHLAELQSAAHLDNLSIHEIYFTVDKSKRLLRGTQGVVASLATC